MIKTLGTLCSLGVLLAAVGCESLVSNRPDPYATTQAEMERLRADVARLRTEVSEIRTVQERLFSEVSGGQVARGADVQRLEGRLAQVERSVQTQAAERDRLRDEIVGQASARIADVLKAQRQAPAPVSGPSGPQTGYEHIVKPGETLSEIAKAYNVSVAAIVKANNMASADMLRVGQKLFIPE